MPDREFNQSILLARCEAAAELDIQTEAVIFVRLSLESLARQLGPNASSSRITPATLCTALLRCDITSENSISQLKTLGILSSGCVGEIVAWLAADELIHTRPSEPPAAFVGPFELPP